jgi:CBS domain containing-hemolysin-like protein
MVFFLMDESGIFLLFALLTLLNGVFVMSKLALAFPLQGRIAGFAKLVSKDAR